MRRGTNIRRRQDMASSLPRPVRSSCILDARYAGPLPEISKVVTLFACRACSALNSFFVEGGAMNFIEKSAITTNEYWLRVYRSCPNFAQ